MAHGGIKIGEVAVAGQAVVAVIAQPSMATPHAFPKVTELAPKPNLKVAVHDRSRLEWVVTVPIAAVGEEQTWDTTFDITIPDAIWLAHLPWDHFTVRSRLMSPVLQPGHRQEGAPIEQLRRRALAAVHELKKATEAIGGQLLAIRRRDRLIAQAEGTDLLAALHAAVDGATQARQALDYLRDARDEALEREHGLADEFVSNQVLMLVTKIVRMMGPLRARSGRIDPALQGDRADAVQAAVLDILKVEIAHRKQNNIKFADAHDAHEIEGFVQRGALLKKHFQQALFVEARAYMLDQRLRNWIAAAMAMVASVFYFVGQIWLFANATAASTTFSLLVACAVGALVYAAKDRIKELGRDWLASRVKHGYADRVAHLSLQERMDPNHSDFALARETITLSRKMAPDPLNAALGDTSVVHQLVIKERLKHDGLPILHQQGLVGLKHVFRYDFSPLLVKLDDQLKRVPVVGMARVHLKASTRVYSLPVTVRVHKLGTDFAITQRGHLRIRRNGLERFVAH